MAKQKSVNVLNARVGQVSNALCKTFADQKFVSLFVDQVQHDNVTVHVCEQLEMFLECLRLHAC